MHGGGGAGLGGGGGAACLHASAADVSMHGVEGATDVRRPPSNSEQVTTSPNCTERVVVVAALVVVQVIGNLWKIVDKSGLPRER